MPHVLKNRARLRLVEYRRPRYGAVVYDSDCLITCTPQDRWSPLPPSTRSWVSQLLGSSNSFSGSPIVFDTESLSRAVGVIMATCVSSQFFSSRVRPDNRLTATAVIMSITASSPFLGESDQNLSVAYISALILYYMVSMNGSFYFD